MKVVAHVLLAHDAALPPLGYVGIDEEGRLCVAFEARMQMTRRSLFDIFGNCGVRVTAERNGYIERAQLLEWSV